MKKKFCRWLIFLICGVIMTSCGMEWGKDTDKLKNAYVYSEEELYATPDDKAEIIAIWLEDEVPFFIVQNLDKGSYEIKSVNEDAVSCYEKGFASCLAKQQNRDKQFLDMRATQTYNGYLYVCMSGQDSDEICYYRIDPDSEQCESMAVALQLSPEAEYLSRMDIKKIDLYVSRGGNMYSVLDDQQICRFFEVGIVGTPIIESYNEGGKWYFGNGNAYSIWDKRLLRWKFLDNSYNLVVYHRNGLTPDGNAVYLDNSDNLYLADYEGILYFNINNGNDVTKGPLWELMVDARNQTVFDEEKYECKNLLYDEETESFYLCVKDKITGNERVYHLQKGE